MIFQLSIIDSFRIDSGLIHPDSDWMMLSPEQIEQLKLLHGTSYQRRLDFENAVYQDRNGWGHTGNKLHDKQIDELKLKMEALFRIRTIPDRSGSSE